MIVYKISNKRFAEDLTGTGAKLLGGRWNSPGHSVLYTSLTPALAAIEVLVNVSDLLHVGDYVIVRIYIPDTLKLIQINKQFLPNNWENFGNNEITRKIGDEWINEGSAVALQVPSKIINDEFNVIINPNHPDFTQVKILSIENFTFDSRTGFKKEIESKIKYDPIIQKQKARINSFEYDIFISHASEDKENIVLPLVKEINKYHLRYWFDQEQIAWGHSITNKINDGISKSRFILAVISNTFLNKSWTMAELQTALNKQISSKNTIILPLLIGNDEEREEIFNKIFLLRDSKYVVWNNNPEQIVDLIVARLNND